MKVISQIVQIENVGNFLFTQQSGSTCGRDLFFGFGRIILTTGSRVGGSLDHFIQIGTISDRIIIGLDDRRLDRSKKTQSGSENRHIGVRMLKETVIENTTN